jgi:sarcosine oxidase
MIGPRDSGLVAGTLESARAHDIDVTELDASAMRTRFPALVPGDHMIGVLEHNAGVLDPEACVRAHLEAARVLGAEVRVNCRATRLTSERGVVRIELGGDVITARRVIIAAGPWTKPLLATAGVDLPLVVERQTMHWFDAGASRASFDPDHLPVTLIEHAEGRYVYFVPDMGRGVKAAIHYEGRFVDADHAPREITPADITPVRNQLARFAPALDAPPATSAVCLYTNTPDKHFLVDDLRDAPGVFVLSACSGHGFKFASALGEIAARGSLGETLSLDLDRFRAARFA